MKKNDEADYMAFMIRLWRERNMTSWRATLESPHTGERYGFADLETLFAFIQSQTNETTTPAEPTDHDGEPS